MGFKFRFSWRTLLLAVPIVGVCLWFGTSYYRLSEARRNFDYTISVYGAGRATHDDLCNSSRGWRTAESRVPFGNPLLAGLDHPDRINSLQEQYEARLSVTIYGSGEPERVLQIYRKHRREANEWLRAL